MSVVDKFKQFMNIDDDDDDDRYEEDVQYDDDGYIDPADQNINEKEPEVADTRIRTFPPKQPTKGKKMPTHQDGASVCVFKPTSITESREITNTLRANKTVLLNLEDADDLSAQRILDFTSGSCYALDGTLQKISNYIFIVTPASVEITGDLQESITGAFGTSI